MIRASIENPIFDDYQSSDGIIRVRRENIGEFERFVSGDYWHLNRAFEGRSLFFGSGIGHFIDPSGRFLVLRDAGVILLFDYRDGQVWNGDLGTLNPSFPKVTFVDDRMVFSWEVSVHPQRLGDHLKPGLGDSHDGFLSHWRPGAARENQHSIRLKGHSCILE